MSTWRALALLASLSVACRTGLLADEDAGVAASPDGGSCGPGAPRLDAGAPPTLDDIARVALLAASCMGEGGAAASALTGDVLARWPEDPFAARLVACDGATDCPSLFACFGGDVVTTGGFVPDARCHGTTIVAGGRHLDCCSFGLQCWDEGSLGERAYCLRAGCAPSTTTCSGETAVACNGDGYATTFACAPAGATCAGGACVGTGAPCDPNRTDPACSGTTATACVGGRLAAVDCAAHPLRKACQAGACTFPLDGVDCLLGNAMCMGTSVVLCAGPAGGVWKTVDCRAISFQACVDGACR